MSIRKTPAGTYRACCKFRGRRESKVFTTESEARHWQVTKVARWKSEFKHGNSFADSVLLEELIQRRGISWVLGQLSAITDIHWKQRRQISGN